MQQIARSVALAFNNLPRPHRVMLGSLTVLTLAVAVWRPYVYHRDATPIVKTIELEQNEIRSLYLKPVSRLIKLHKKMKPFLRTNWMTKSPVKRACMNMLFPLAIR
ncbi:putative peptidoglycan-binding peptidase [Escherichia coli]|uniref:Putative peptidoglycan-binding peptidase n=1 Tax=Escherichia coli TaxID=562 RepID=A0A377A693_ECOLX|nr:putative peptidoglycan-binding peptidase [Escherichia coli]